MTPEEQVTEVRARLEQMAQVADASAETWISAPFWWTLPDLTRRLSDENEDAAYIAAASPDLLLRVARKDLEILNDHAPEPAGRVMACKGEHGNYSHSNEWPCPEVEAVLRAWQP